MWDVDEQTFKDIRSIITIDQVSFSEAVRCHHLDHSGTGARVDARCSTLCLQVSVQRVSGVSTQAGFRQRGFMRVCGL